MTCAQFLLPLFATLVYGGEELNDEAGGQMYRSLLVPLDGSAAAEHAIPTALSIARRFTAALTLVHVYQPAQGIYVEGGWYDETANRELREDAQAYLDGVIQRLSPVDVPVNTALVEGPVASMIKRQADVAGADLVVMTTHGRGLVARFWLGSVSDALVRQMTIPILLVRPPDADANPIQEPKCARVLVPLDGSQLAEQILEPAAALAAATQAEVTLLRVVQQFTPDSYDPNSNRLSGIRPALLKQLQEVDRREMTRAEEYLDQLAKRLRTQSLIVQARVVSHLRPATAILDDASTNGIDLIALATHGRGGLKRLLIGSVADKVLRGATTPVLVYRPVGESVSPEE